MTVGNRIDVEGAIYEVIEDLGFRTELDMRLVMIDVGGLHRVAYQKLTHKTWRFWDGKERATRYARTT
jgi:hypothetical protein